MRTSIADIIRIEKFLSGDLDAGEKLFFQSRLLVDKGLKHDVFLQRLAHRLVRLYHRKKVKEEVEDVHARLFQNPEKARFRESVLQYFNS